MLEAFTTSPWEELVLREWGLRLGLHHQLSAAAVSI